MNTTWMFLLFGKLRKKPSLRKIDWNQGIRYFSKVNKSWRDGRNRIQSRHEMLHVQPSIMHPILRRNSLRLRKMAQFLKKINLFSSQNTLVMNETQFQTETEISTLAFEVRYIRFGEPINEWSRIIADYIPMDDFKVIFNQIGIS
jgi:hypothetical protein